MVFVCGMTYVTCRHLQKTEEGIRLLEVEVMVVASGFWEANLGLLKEQRKLRTTEPSLQLASLLFFLSMGFQVYR